MQILIGIVAGVIAQMLVSKLWARRQERRQLAAAKQMEDRQGKAASWAQEQFKGKLPFPLPPDAQGGVIEIQADSPEEAFQKISEHLRKQLLGDKGRNDQEELDKKATVAPDYSKIH